MASKLLFIVALSCITLIFSSVNCANSMVATLGGETLNTDGCDNMQVCQISCSKDYADDLQCLGIDPTPKDALNSPWAINVLIPSKFKLDEQYHATCGRHSDPSARISRGLKWIVEQVGPKVLKLLKIFPINILIPRSQQEIAKKQVAAGVALCLNTEFQDFWIDMGRKCAKEANGKIALHKLLAEFRANKWKDATILPNIATVDTVDKYNHMVIRLLFEGHLRAQNKDVASSWRWNPRDIPNIFWNYFAYLANLRASCKCANIAQTLETSKLPDGTTGRPEFVNLAALKDLKDIGRQVCASKFKQCKPTAGSKVLEDDSESNTEDISNAL